jgi:hypothetical protein
MKFNINNADIMKKAEKMLRELFDSHNNQYTTNRYSDFFKQSYNEFSIESNISDKRRKKLAIKYKLNIDKVLDESIECPIVLKHCMYMIWFKNCLTKHYIYPCLENFKYLIKNKKCVICRKKIKILEPWSL